MLKATQVAEKVGKVARGSKTVSEAAAALARGDKKLLEQLRLAAGDAKITEVVTEAMRPGLGSRIGAEITIDGKLGADVQVLYQVDERGRTFVTAVKVGPNAKVGDILAHAGTVKALDRYSGLAGKCRDLWDRICSFAGMGRTAEQPFEAGSKAAESYQELQKLDKLIAYRRAMLQEMLEQSPSATGAQAVIRKEIRGSGAATQPLTGEHIAKLGLVDLHETLTRLAGRDVNFMVFAGRADAAAKGTTIWAW